MKYAIVCRYVKMLGKKEVIDLPVVLHNVYRMLLQCQAKLMDFKSNSAISFTVRIFLTSTSLNQEMLVKWLAAAWMNRCLQMVLGRREPCPRKTPPPMHCSLPLKVASVSIPCLPEVTVRVCVPAPLKTTVQVCVPSPCSPEEHIR